MGSEMCIRDSTNLACSSRTVEYWPSVVYVRTSLRSVRTATTSGQYSPLRPSRSVSKRLVFLRVVPYFEEPVGRVQIRTTSENSQRYYTTKRLIRDLLCLCGRISRILIYRECVTNMRSRTELAREIQLTDWSTAGGFLWFRPSHHWRKLFIFSQWEKIVFRSSKPHINSSFSL